jgi:hypothetical protein
MSFAKKSPVCLMAGILCFAGLARAETLVSFSFGGYLGEVDPSLAGVFEVGDPFFGSLTYDLEAEDQLPANQSYGIYHNMVAFSCVINGTHYASATVGHVNLPVGNVMDWLVDGGFSGDVAAGMTPQFVNIPLFENQSNPVLTTDAMPAEPFPSMLAFGSAEFRIRYGPTWNENEVRGWITQDDSPVAVRATSWSKIKAQY